MSQIQKIYTLIFSLLFAIIPFTEHMQAVPNILIGVLAVCFPFVVKKEDLRKSDTKIIYLFLVLILVIGTGIIVFKRWEDTSIMMKIIIIPTILMLSFPIKKYKLPIYFFLISSIGLLLASSIKIALYYQIHKTLNLDVGAVVNDLLLGERPYLGFIYLSSFCLSIYLYKTHEKKWMKTCFIILAILFCGFILFISARLSILSLLIIISISVFYAKNKLRNFMISIASIAILVLIGFSNPNFISRLTAGFKQSELKLEKIIKLEPRSHIWECSAEICKSTSNSVLGIGFKNTTRQLSVCFSTHQNFINEEQRNFFIDSQFNTHNQFLSFYLGSGVLSLLIFLCVFYLLFKNNYKKYITFALVLAILLFCVFENVLSRQLGAMLFGLSLSIIFFLNRIQKNNTTINAE